MHVCGVWSAITPLTSQNMNDRVNGWNFSHSIILTLLIIVDLRVFFSHKSAAPAASKAVFFYNKDAIFKKNVDNTHLGHWALQMTIIDVCIWRFLPTPISMNTKTYCWYVKFVNFNCIHSSFIFYMNRKSPSFVNDTLNHQINTNGKYLRLDHLQKRTEVKIQARRMRN